MNKVQIQIIKDALDAEDKLTEWEWGFVNSLADLPGDTPLSEKQNEVLNRIGQKVLD